MVRSPLIDALRGDLTVLQDTGAIDTGVLPAFDAVAQQSVPADFRDSVWEIGACRSSSAMMLERPDPAAQIAD